MKEKILVLDRDSALWLGTSQVFLSELQFGLFPTRHYSLRSSSCCQFTTVAVPTL